MPLLIALLVASFAIFAVMIGIILGSGSIEGKKRPEQQGRP